MGRGSVSHTDRERNIPRERSAEGKDDSRVGAAGDLKSRDHCCSGGGRLRPRQRMIAQGYMSGWARANCSPHAHDRTMSSVSVPWVSYPHHKALAYNGPLAWLGTLYQCWTHGVHRTC